jgi:hypothetical protein
MSGAGGAGGGGGGELPAQMASLFMQFYEEAGDNTETLATMDEGLVNSTLRLEVTHAVYETALEASGDDEESLCVQLHQGIYLVEGISDDSMLVPATYPFVYMAAKAFRYGHFGVDGNSVSYHWEEGDSDCEYAGAVKRAGQTVQGIVRVTDTVMTYPNEEGPPVCYREVTSYACLFAVINGVLTMRVGMKKK